MFNAMNALYGQIIYSSKCCLFYLCNKIKTQAFMNKIEKALLKCLQEIYTRIKLIKKDDQIFW